MQKNKYQVKDRKVAKVMRLYRRLPISIPFDKLIILNSLKLYFFFRRAYINLTTEDNTEETDNIFRNLNIFFGFAVIRSGTHFLANFLNSELDKAVITHEAIVADYLAYSKTYNDKKCENYLEVFRKRDIYKRIKGSGINTYGEINPFLRRHISEIKKAFPNAKIFHLVRNGKKVVRSIMCRATFGAKDPLGEIVKPDNNSPYYAKWDNMSRFEKVCWMWQEDNRKMRNEAGYSIKFEELVSDYDYFKDKLLDYLNIYISKDKWGKYVNRPKNISPVYSFPEWKKWTEEQKNQFINICGEEMEINGYKI